MTYYKNNINNLPKIKLNLRTIFLNKYINKPIEKRNTNGIDIRGTDIRDLLQREGFLFCCIILNSNFERYHMKKIDDCEFQNLSSDITAKYFDQENKAHL